MKGFIYKITSSQTDKIYIGSTICSLQARLRLHKSKTKCETNNCNSKLIVCYDDHKIELIEEVEVENEIALRKREGEHIKLNREICVNRKVAGQTREEYTELNKDYFSEYRKNRYSEQKEDISAKQKEYYEANKIKILERDKIYREKNKDVIRERRNAKIKCECGKEMHKSNLNRHKKTNCNIFLKT